MPSKSMYRWKWLQKFFQLETFLIVEMKFRLSEELLDVRNRFVAEICYLHFKFGETRKVISC